MKCLKCEATNEVGAKFCANCGAPLTASVDNQPEERIHPERNEPAHSDVAPPKEPSQFVEKTKATSLNYWRFLQKTFKSPYETSKTVTDDKNDLVNGLITSIVFALFIPLFTYFSARAFGRGFFGTYSPPFWDTVILPFILLILFLAVIVGIIFAVSRFLKANIDFLAVFTRFATLLVVPAALAILSVIFILFNAYVFSSLLFTLAFALMFLANIATIVGIRETHGSARGLDLFYVIIINFAIIGVVLALLGDAVFGDIISYLDW